MAEVITFISGSCCWKNGISLPPLKTLFKKKKSFFFAASAFIINIYTQLLHYSAAVQHLICSTTPYPFLGYFLNRKLLD